MQRFYASAKNGWVASEVFNGSNGNAEVFDERLGAAGRIEFDVLLV